MTFDAALMCFADLAGQRMAYRVAGHGPALLLIHGAEADHTMFDDLIAALSGHCTVIAYDQRDSGQTVNNAEPYDLADLAADAAALIDHLGLPRAHVFGTSLGGTIAQALASRHPERVDHLVLGSTWRAGRPLASFNPAAAQELARLRSDPAAHAATIAQYFFTPTYLDTHPERIERFRSPSRTEAQRTRRAHMQAHPPAIDLTAIRAPTLLLAGSADRLIPTEASFALAREIKQAECESLEGLPHVGAIEAPARVAESILRFIDSPSRLPGA